MKIQLDKQLCDKLREKINECHNFAHEKTANFKFPTNRRNEVTSSAYNCICATLDRISDLVEHCNNIEIEGQFGLCDFFNHTHSLIECISIIGKVYGVESPYKGEKNRDISIFQMQGINNKGNDEKYFKYLRSLCSVHPVETSRHVEYQGDQAEWCPYILSGRNIAISLCRSDENADYVAIVYRNDMKLSKHVPIYVDKLIIYVQKRYQHIEQVIKGIENYNQNLIEEYKMKHIPEPEDFTDYTIYLNNLQNAITERCGKNHSVKIKEWICIMKAHFADEDMQEKLIAYQEAFKRGISNIHKNLQQMNIDSYFEEEPISSDTSFIKNTYALGKLCYLEEEFWSLSIDEAIILAETGGELFCNKRIDNMLSMISEAANNGATDEEINAIAKSIDRQYTTSNSEWARIQLKIIEPYFHNVVVFDYHLNDWFLHLQVEIAFWIVAQKS